jgi:hypothetical protein
MRKIETAALIFGVFAGIGGATHGPGEILQGNIAPGEILIKAWPELTALNGEPAMTIVPSFLVTGILAVILGMAVAVWSAKFIQRKESGVVLILLSIIMLLVGAASSTNVWNTLRNNHHDNQLQKGKEWRC